MAVRGLPSIRRLVAVIGCQRSGTTLVGGLLGAHRNAFLIDEYDGLYEWFAAQAAGDDQADALLADMLARASAKYATPHARTGAAGLGPAISHLVLKAPNLTYAREALARFPVQVSIIYPVRDPRAVVTSMARLSHIDFIGNQLRLLDDHPEMVHSFAEERGRLADATLGATARRATIWRLKSDLARWWGEAGLQVRQFRYEDLVADPSGVLASLERHACLAESRPSARPEDAYVGVGPGGTDRTRAVDRISADGWRAELSPSEESEVFAFAGPAAAKFGYAPRSELAGRALG